MARKKKNFKMDGNFGGIVDFDLVDESNLQRQIVFDVSDIGKQKTEIAKAKLQKQNPFVEIDILLGRGELILPSLRFKNCF